MKRIAILGANEFQNPLILKAKELGYETHVFAWKTGDIGERTADVFYDISILEKEKICKICKKINVDGVASIGSDVAVGTVNYILRELGHATNPEITDYIATNKYAMRSAMQKAGISVPAYCIADEKFKLSMLQNFNFPLIVKPTDRSGSRGIYKVFEKNMVEQAVLKAQEISFEHKAIIEEFFEGEEYSCEGISYGGEHRILAYTKKFTTGSPHFVETGHVQPAEFTDAEKQRIETVVKKALDALQIKYGASHTEFRVNTRGEIMIIEVGARMGGDCIGSDLVPLTTGYDYMKMVIDISCGLQPDFTQNQKYDKAEIQFIFSEKDKEQYKNIMCQSKEKIIRASIACEVNDGIINNSADRSGFYIMAEK